MTDQELNEDMARRAGFIEGDIKHHYYWNIGGNRVAKWIEPKTKRNYGVTVYCKLPNFTKSTDACFEWLTPYLILKFSYESYCKFIREWADEFTLHNMKPARAFCEAVKEVE